MPRGTETHVCESCTWHPLFVIEEISQSSFLFGLVGVPIHNLVCWRRTKVAFLPNEDYPPFSWSQWSSTSFYTPFQSNIKWLPCGLFSNISPMCARLLPPRKFFFFPPSVVKVHVFTSFIKWEFFGGSPGGRIPHFFSILTNLSKFFFFDQRLVFWLPRV